MVELRIATDLALPAEAVTQTFAVLAKRGVGKTYTALVLVEELLKAGLQTVVVDPIGVTWGLRAAADGQRPGLPIVILGGDHGDVPLALEAGEVIADLVVEEGLAIVLDLSRFRKGEQTRFMTDFCERLYHRNRAPLHLVLDEADAFAPQRPLPGQQRLLGAVEDLVRRGRARGVGVTLVSQRAAVLNKDVLTQAEVLIALRTIAPQDRDAIDAWVRVHGTPEQREALMASLPSLPIGTAWFWSPGWLDIFQRVQVRRRETFDSSATPKVGQQLQTPKRLADVDLAQLRARIAATIEKARAEDPRLLRRRIAELEHALGARAATERTVTVVERVEVPVLDQAAADRLSATAQALADLSKDLGAIADAIVRALARATSAAPPQAIPEPPAARLPAPRLPPPSPAGTAVNDPERKLPLAERKILTALAQYPQGRTKQQVALLAAYAITGGGFNNALSALRGQGWIEGNKDRLRITAAGRDALGAWVPLPTGRALADHWIANLPKAERTILQILIDAYPGTLTKQETAAAAGYEPTGGGFNNALGRLRTLELIEGRSELQASATFFEDPGEMRRFG
jgi:uncharacterized protein